MTKQAFLSAALLLTPAMAAADQATDAAVRQIVIDLQQNQRLPQSPSGRLAQLGPRAIPELLRLIPRIERPGVLRLVGARLEELNATASIQSMIDTLAHHYPREPYHRTEPAVEVLVQWSSQAVGPLIRGIDSPNLRIRYGCALALKELCVRGVTCDKRIPPVFYRLAKTGDAGMQKVVAQALLTRGVWFRHDKNGEGGILPAEVDDREAFRALIDLAIDADDEALPEVRGAVWRYLSTQRGAPVAKSDEDVSSGRLFAREREKLAELLKSKDPGVRMAVLALLPYPSVEGEPIDALADESADVRYVALKSMAESIPADWVPAIAAQLKSKRPEIRAIAAQALGMSYRREALPILVPMLKDSHPSVRDAVKRAIARIKGRRLSARGEFGWGLRNKDSGTRAHT